MQKWTEDNPDQQGIGQQGLQQSQSVRSAAAQATDALQKVFCKRANFMLSQSRRRLLLKFNSLLMVLLNPVLRSGSAGQQADPHQQCFSMRCKVTSDGAVLLRQLEEGGTNSDEAAAAQEGVLTVFDAETQAEDDKRVSWSASCCRPDQAASCGRRSSAQGRLCPRHTNKCWCGGALHGLVCRLRRPGRSHDVRRCSSDKSCCGGCGADGAGGAVHDNRH